MTPPLDPGRSARARETTARAIRSRRRGASSALRRARALALVGLLAGAPGCHSYLLPFDERPLPASGPIETRGGARLHLDASGDLVLRPAPGDVSALLGAGLAPTDGGLVVTHRLEPETLLRPGDVIVHVAALPPPGGALIQRTHAAALALQSRAEPDFFEEQTEDQPDTVPGEGRLVVPGGSELRSPFDAFDPAFVADLAADTAAVASDVAAVRARRGGHPVCDVEDLRGYFTGHGWVVVDLVVRRGGEEVVVRQRLSEPSEWVPPTRSVYGDSGASRWNGVELVSLSHWPEERLPVHAQQGDQLVARVARDSPLARAGLRPLDLVPRESVHALLSPDGRRDVRVRDRQGRPKVLHVVPRPEPVDVWIPGLFSFQDDGVRWHLGLGPFELLYHASGRVEYAPATDTYERMRRWSVGTSVQSAWIEGEGGQRATGGVNLFFDGARTAYWVEWWDADEERRRRRAAWD